MMGIFTQSRPFALNHVQNLVHVLVHVGFLL
jgi:hypothetical protein